MIFFIMFYDGLSGGLYFVCSLLIHAFTHRKMLVGTDLSKSNPHLWPENKADITFNFNRDCFTFEWIEKVLVCWGVESHKLICNGFRNVFGNDYMDDRADIKNDDTEIYCEGVG